MKSGVSLSGAESAPSKTISTTSLRSWARASTSFSRGPRQSGVAHRTRSPLHAGHVRIGEAAPIAGALADGGDLDLLEARLQLVQRQRERSGRSFAADIELPGGRVDPRDLGEVIADEEGVVRRDRVGEIGRRRFVIGRARGEPDQRALPGERLHRRRCRRRPPADPRKGALPRRARCHPGART